ncbi:MAG: M67 family metallopeptidase [Nitrospinae bacterium]|nr:M67 family metallopeptidase [Nitrospinota bacterium]
MLPLSKDKLEEVREHALAEYPYECCGIVIGKPETEEEDILFRCTNIQNKLHEMDPKTYPRDARTAYNMEPRDLMRIFKEAETKRMSIKLFYHSHPDHDAYFSEEDKKMALFDGEPTYPDAKYLVVSVYNKEVKDEAWFAWNERSESFDKQNP